MTPALHPAGHMASLPSPQPAQPCDTAHRHPLREPLVWLVAGIPLLTIVAGLVTLWIAFQRADSNVTDDYYKEGLGINRRIERDDLARALGVAGRLSTDREFIATADGRRLAIDLALTGAPQAFEPQVSLRMTHPVHQSLDRLVVLQAVGNGRYRGQTDAEGLDGTRWSLALETSNWRLALPGVNALAGGSLLELGETGSTGVGRSDDTGPAAGVIGTASGRAGAPAARPGAVRG